MRLLSNSQP